MDRTRLAYRRRGQGVGVAVGVGLDLSDTVVGPAQLAGRG